MSKKVWDDRKRECAEADPRFDFVLHRPPATYISYSRQPRKVENVVHTGILKRVTSFARWWCATGPVSVCLVIAMIAYGFRRSSVLLVHKALLLTMNLMFGLVC
jgi:hypothetical protein